MVTPSVGVFGVAVPAALLGAAAMGLANVTQAQATHQVPASGLIDLQLVWRLLRHPLWLLGIGATVAGLVLQMVALGYGPLLLVQPLLVTALLFTTIFGAWLGHQRPDRMLTAAAGLCVLGLAAFLATAAPTETGNRIDVPLPQVLPLAVTFTAIITACLVVAYHAGPAARALALALATGVLYGITAALMKLIAGQFRTAPEAPFTHWALYTAVVIGPAGFLLSQHAFQQGKLAAPAVAVITTVDPLVGMGIGLDWFGETLRHGPAALAGQTLAGIAIIAGIAMLAHRAQHLTPGPADPSTNPRPPGRRPRIR